MSQLRTPPPSEGRASPALLMDDPRPSKSVSTVTSIEEEEPMPHIEPMVRLDVGEEKEQDRTHGASLGGLHPGAARDDSTSVLSRGRVLESDQHLVKVESQPQAREVSPLHDLPLRSPSALPSTTVTRDHSSSNDRTVHKTIPHLTIETGKSTGIPSSISPHPRPSTARAVSTPANIKGLDTGNILSQRPGKSRTSSRSDIGRSKVTQQINGSVPSPTTTSVSLPSLSLPTYLQLELSSYRPSQFFGHPSAGADFPYESSQVKIERLLNFIFLPLHLEGVLLFGSLACLDSWLYTFTILPLRVLKSLYILSRSWLMNLVSEIQFVFSFIFSGLQRMWQRRGAIIPTVPDSATARTPSQNQLEPSQTRGRARSTRQSRQMRSSPSTLLPDDKADILKGLLILTTCMVLLRLDASRMYHWVRGQAAIKLYVIYNVLEVCDRLLAAIGQDVLECLFSLETLERKANGRSKVLRPLWLFILALGYTIVHSTALFYQVVTLNVAVNSYSNALITLLMSNQFVEIKSTVFKKFEKDNLFQLTCADVVERFQLWHMLMIIAARNIVETGGLNFGVTSIASSTASSSPPLTTNTTATPVQYIPQVLVCSIWSRSSDLVSTLVTTIQTSIPVLTPVIMPFVIVLGSEMLIDWLKHAYINKFNNVRPTIYGRFLDVLAKDYYTNAFGDQDLTKRLGLPVIPLSCLMIRASVQTYHMFVAALVRIPSPSAASLASIHELYSATRNATPTSTAAMIAQKLDAMLYSIPSSVADSELSSHFTTILLMLLIFLVLLAFKLMLGMSLLALARSRYQKTCNAQDKNSGHYVDGSKRVGGWGVVEVDDEKRRWIYDDDPAGYRAIKEREARDVAKRETEKAKGISVEGLDKVKRYEMVAKRIW